MFGRFLPRETSFFDFFEQHAALTIEGTKEFLSLVTTGANIAAKCRRIADIEHETDTITHRCVEALHKTFITPIDRDEIHRLITRMDDIMDYVEAAAERIELYEMTDDDRRRARPRRRARTRSAQQVEARVRGLRDAQGAAGDRSSCASTSTASRTRPTRSCARSVARLFKEEKDPIIVIKWKEIYENLENATDRCEDVANIIEGVILEHA